MVVGGREMINVTQHNETLHQPIVQYLSIKAPIIPLPPDFHLY
jgi:hypothetical protein